ncbi:MAG: protein kinase [Planctomycetes bacterium]|nr:protein kinase [Planctomycetota bacterium]
MPPHREKEPAHQCPNCGASIKARAKEESKGSGVKRARSHIALTQSYHKKFPDHRITPAECEVVQEISRRGAGISYLARHPEVEDYVTVKAFIPEYSVSEEVTGRWTRVSRLAEDLKHPRFAKVLGVGIMEGVPCVVREYVEGKTLAEMMYEGALDLRQGLFYLGQVLEAIEDAHSRRVVHGNIKPSNIIIDTRGRAMIADPGLYPPRDAPDTADHFVASLPYMAPELLSGDEPPQPTVDVYSAAAVLYDIAANKPPFVANTIAQVRQNILSGDYTAPRQLNPKTSKLVEHLIKQSLCVEPIQRYASAHSLVVDLHRVYKGQKPLSYKEKKSPILSAIRTLFYTVLVTGLIGALGWGGYTFWSKHQAEKQRGILLEARAALLRGDNAKVTELAPTLAGTAYNGEALMLEATALYNLRHMDKVVDITTQMLETGLSADLVAQARWLRVKALVSLGRVGEAASNLASIEKAVFDKHVQRVEVESFLGQVSGLASDDPEKREQLKSLLEKNLLPQVTAPDVILLVNLYSARLTDEPAEAAGIYRGILTAGGAVDAGIAKAAAEDFSRLFLDERLKLTAEDAALFAPAAEVLTTLGQQLMLRGRNEEASEAWRSLESRTGLPESTRRMLILLKTREMEGGADKGEVLNRYLELGLKNDPAGLWALMLAARLRLNAGDIRAAAGDLKNIENDVNTPGALREQASICLGHCWRAQGRSDQALAFYRKARSGSKSAKVTVESMSSEIEALVETESLDAARRLLRSLRSIAPDAPETAAAAYILVESDTPPQGLEVFHQKYLRALRMESETRYAAARDAFQALENEAKGVSWYGLMARYRNNLLKNR